LPRLARRRLVDRCEQVRDQVALRTSGEVQRRGSGTWATSAVQ